MFRSSVVSIGLRSYLTDNTVLSIIKYSDLNAGFNAKCLLLYTSQLYQMRYFTPRSCTKCDTLHLAVVPNAILYTSQLYQMRYSGRSGFAMRKATGARDIMLLQVTVDFNNCQSE